MLDSSGFVLTSASHFDGGMGGRVLRMFSSEMDMDATPTDLKVLFGSDEKEHPARLVAKDSDLGLAFVKVRTSGTPRSRPRPRGPLDPAVGSTLLGLTRMGRGFDCAPRIGYLLLEGKVERPRPMWAVDGTFSASGCRSSPWTGRWRGSSPCSGAPGGANARAARAWGDPRCAGAARTGALRPPRGLDPPGDGAGQAPARPAWTAERGGRNRSPPRVPPPPAEPEEPETPRQSDRPTPAPAGDPWAKRRRIPHGRPPPPPAPLRVAVVGAGPSGFYVAPVLLRVPGLTSASTSSTACPRPTASCATAWRPTTRRSRPSPRPTRRPPRTPASASSGTSSSAGRAQRRRPPPHVHAVVFCTGAQTDRHLDVPGEDLVGSHPATEFVAWYNGHPDYADCMFDLSCERAVVIGVGNVAIDVARILGRSPDELAKTDIADSALEALRESRIREVYLAGRRGPAQAAFTNAEVEEVGELAEADAVTLPAEVALDECRGPTSPPAPTA